jgi:hypothetical protein
MNRRHGLTHSLTTIGLLGLLGSAAAAQAGTVHGAQGDTGGGPPQAVEQTPGVTVPPAPDSWDPWAELHRVQEGIDALFAESWARVQAATGGAQPILSEPPGMRSPSTRSPTTIGSPRSYPA